MNFLEQMTLYYKGEWLEALLLAAFAVVAGGVAFAAWQYSQQNALLKGMLYPLVFISVVGVAVGGFGVYNNSQRINQFPSQYQQDTKAFVKTEYQRFEGSNGVNKWWLPLKITWATLIVLGLFLTFLMSGAFWHGLAIGFFIVGTAGLVIDGFAHHRAQVYTEALRSHSIS
jgi:hypothetical protein